MSEPSPQSLRRLLLTHEVAFVILVVMSGGLGATWAWFWQQWSAESIRLNHLSHTAQEIRSQLFKQIQAVSVAGLRGDQDVRELNSDYVARGQELFNELRRQSAHRGEDYAVQHMQTAFSFLQARLREALADPAALNRLVRARVLDPAFSSQFVADFEAAFESFRGLINHQLDEQQQTIRRWTDLAPYGLGVPIVFGVALLFVSRGSLARGFVKPVHDILDGTRRLSDGHLDHHLPGTGSSELQELAQGINHMARELEASRDALRTHERQSALGGLVPVVAHNVRNPLAAIRANAQLLEGAESPAETAEMAEAIIDTVDRLERWVTALVSYLHPLEPRRRPTDIADVIAAACALLESRAQERGVTLVQEDGDGLLIDADPDLLEQAVYGLLTNAVEASARGGSVRCTARAADDEIIVDLIDEAGGIPFTPEPSELEPGPSTKRFGTGLGIPIAYKICAVHGYVLEFHVDEGTGTRVEIRAPRVAEAGQ